MRQNEDATGLYSHGGECLPAQRDPCLARRTQRRAVTGRKPGLRRNRSARPSRRVFGELGERLGVQYLLAKGYRIRERNFRVREGEIDIVAQRGDILAFVEVRCRRGDAMGSAGESLSQSKQRRLLGLADAYEQVREDLPEERRIDVIAVDFAPSGKLISLDHIEGAITADAA